MNTYTIPYLPPNTLPGFELSTQLSLNNSDEQRKMRIFLDWPADDKLFTEDNYLSLETLLAVYPLAKYRYCDDAFPNSS